MKAIFKIYLALFKFKCLMFLTSSNYIAELHSIIYMYWLFHISCKRLSYLL